MFECFQRLFVQLTQREPFVLETPLEVVDAARRCVEQFLFERLQLRFELVETVFGPFREAQGSASHNGYNNFRANQFSKFFACAATEDLSPLQLQSPPCWRSTSSSSIPSRDHVPCGTSIRIASPT